MTDIPMKFAIPILAVVALPLVGALYNFAVSAPQPRQAQSNDNKFAGWLRANNEDPCNVAALTIRAVANSKEGRDVKAGGDCHVTYNANKTQAHIELEASEGVFRFTYIADAVRLPDKGDGWGKGWKITGGYETDRRVATEKSHPDPDINPELIAFSDPAQKTAACRVAKETFEQYRLRGNEPYDAIVVAGNCINVGFTGSEKNVAEATFTAAYGVERWPVTVLMDTIDPNPVNWKDGSLLDGRHYVASR
jgi:hypothetical protein